MTEARPNARARPAGLRGLTIGQMLRERRAQAEQGDPIDLEAINRRRFDRFLQNIKDGRDYTFLSVYFFSIPEAEEIAAELKTSSTLRYLSMPSCYAGRRKIKPIMDALIANDLCRLVYLDLNDNRLEDVGCFLVCSFLKVNKTMQSVSLRSNRITGNGKNSGAKYISDVMKKNKTILRLDLGGNRFGAEGAGMLDEALAVNKTLNFLDLSSNELNAKGVKNLTGLFTQNKTIKFLRLQDNNIGEEGAEQLSAFLSQNLDTNLEHLILLDAYTRVLVLRGLMERVRLEDVNDDLLKKILLKADFHDRKFKTVRKEWSQAKTTGQELVRVPQEVFEFQDAEAIKAFLKAALVEGLSANKAVKMLMVGRARAGKTSLTNSLVNEESGLTKDDDNRATVSVEIRPWRVKDVTISVWDFAGQEEYYMTHTFFLSRRCVVVLIVDLSRYKDFQDDVYYWVKAIQAHVPGVSLFLVGTHIDEMTPEQVKERCDEIVLKFQEEERRVVTALDKQLELLREANVGHYQDLAHKDGNKDEAGKEKEMSKEEAEKLANEYVEDANVDVNAERMNRNNQVVYIDTPQMARIREQRTRRPSILHNRVYAVSSKHMEGVDELRKSIIDHATDEQVAIKLPNSYVKLLEKLKEFGEKNKHAPIVARANVEEVIGKVAEKFDSEDDIDAALELLHLVGQILWYRSHPQLRDRVFASPRWVVDLTKALIRHDMFLTEHGNPGILERLKRPNNVKSKDFSAMKKRFKKNAMFDLRFLALLDTWKDLTEIDRFKLVELLKQFDLLIPMPKKKKSDYDQCLIPLYLKSTFHGKQSSMEEVRTKGDVKANNLVQGLQRKFRKSILGLLGDNVTTGEVAALDRHRVTWRYDLHEYFPEGIFFRLLVRCYNLGTIKEISEDLVYARLGPDIKIVIREVRDENHIVLAASHTKDLQLVWPALVLFASEFEDMLREAYKGVSCQVVCIASDSRLRERALCNHEEHKDMVPPLEYMHVVWGNITAVQVGVLLRLDNISHHLQTIKDDKEKTKTEGYGREAEIHTLATQSFDLLEKLFKNVCKVNDIPIKKGRNMKAYLDSIRASDVYSDKENWKGEPLDDDKLSQAFELYSEAKAREMLDSEFAQRVITLARKLLPDLEQHQTEYEKELMDKANKGERAIEPTIQAINDRVNVMNDIMKEIDEVKASKEAKGINKAVQEIQQKQHDQKRAREREDAERLKKEQEKRAAKKEKTEES